MEYTKAIQRLKNHRNATLDITMARLGKALSYYMLDEPSNCAAELQQLQNGVELFHEEIKKYLAGMEKRLNFSSSWLGVNKNPDPPWTDYLWHILRLSNKAYLPVVDTMLSDLAMDPRWRGHMIKFMLFEQKKSFVVPWEEIHALRDAAASIQEGLTKGRR
jgi:hypothetical protein